MRSAAQAHETKGVIPFARMASEPAPSGDDGEVDAALVAAIAAGAAGDRDAVDALRQLYERHAGLLLGLAMRIVRERRVAEDLLHDVFLEAWRGAKDFDPKRGRVRTWLAIRMRSRALDHQKSARVSRNAGDSGLETLVDETRTATPDHARVRDALGALGTEQRTVLELGYFEGLSCSEIATRIGIPVGTVKSRMAAGLDRLRRRFAPAETPIAAPVGGRAKP
ncbi:MAG: sigma-70 family RNA polymerase sigma factor [Myxococcota bacterium]|nr:sigma-70 family RNA polymerase sigma factor [Myxococcota bacterium]